VGSNNNRTYKRETEKREHDREFGSRRPSLKEKRSWKDGKTHSKLGEVGIVHAGRRHPNF